MATFDFAIVVGDRHFDRGTEVPDEIAEKIMNPDITSGVPAVEPVSGQPAGNERPAKNASTEVWAAYAAGHGVEVPDGATRTVIIEAVEAKVPAGSDTAPGNDDGASRSGSTQD